MPCFRSKPAWQPRPGEPIWFSPPRPGATPDLWIDCNRCEGCKAKKKQEWAIRIIHEAQYHEQNCFVTLTYDDDHLPPDGKIQKTDIQLWMKRLRKELDKDGQKVRYFVTGEYGEKTRRPHYHAIIFGHDFRGAGSYDIKHGMYGNKLLEDKWGMGQITISGFHNNRAFYTAGYVGKKIGDPDTFALQSRNPPIGKKWVLNHKDNIRRLKTIVVGGDKLPIPTVYKNWLEGESWMEQIKQELREIVEPMNDQRSRAKRANYLAQQSLKGSEKV